MMAAEMKVTPWTVEGEIDYKKLIKQFGTEPLTDKLIDKIKKHTGELHLMLRRRLFFSHRGLDWLLNKYDKGERFALYTGRGPSGHTHIGHLVPWIFTKWLQDKFGADLYFQLTDDEKFLMNKQLSLDDTQSFAMENALDVIAVGFDPKKTIIFSDTDYSKTLYKIAVRVAKLTTFSTAKAVFGFDNSTNIGMAFFPSMQAAPCFLPSELSGKKTPVLIPAAIDQDPYWRIARDAAERLGYYKPAQIHSMFLPGLQGPGSKMSASRPNTAIFTTDSLDVAEKKVMAAFTGGRGSLKEQKEKGGNPDVCTVYHYMYYIFEPSDEKMKQMREDCKAGRIMCGECKQRLAKHVRNFLKEHQKRREHARKNIDKFLVKD